MATIKSVEEKAKAYDEAIKKVNDYYEGKAKLYSDVDKTLDYLFPALKESDNERIRKAIIYGMTALKNQGRKTFANVPLNDCIAWLEKQGKDNMGISEATKQELEDNLHKALEKETPESWNEFLDEQGEQKHICKLDNSYARVKFPFKAKVKSSGTIVTIHDGQLSSNGKEWIKYQSDKEDGYKIYEPNNLELVCKIEQKPAWSEEDERMLENTIGLIEVLDRGTKGAYTTKDYTNFLKSLKERYTCKPSDEHYELEEFAKIVRCNLTGISKAVQELFEAKYLQLTGNKMYGGFKD